MRAEANELHFNMVTFDIINAKGKENLYGKVRTYLEESVGRGNYYSFMKQCCFVVTSLPRGELRKEIKKILGPGCNILVVRLQKGRAYRISNPIAKERAREFVRRLKDYEDSD